jgi:amidase
MGTRPHSREAPAAAPAPASEWDFGSIGAVSEALRSRKISASELIDHTIARIEALDQRFNSIDAFAEAQRAAGALALNDRSLEAERARGWAMTHRDWLAANAQRLQMQRQWRAFFREWDVVIYPSAAIPAFPQDQSEPIEVRQVDIDGKPWPYLDAFFIWADPASTCGLPATAVPIERSPSGLPVGVQVIGPYLEDRTPIAFAELLEREFGGFVPPPSLKV